ncbi:MAG: hypothetical protein OXG49_12340 [Chloroflexi bacterium]|nr:hypothetical protein [Chloroflexota bacterium]
MRKLVVSIPDFDNQVKALSKPKKYPKLPSDLKSFKQKLSTGDIASKRARGVKSAPVFGARVEDSSTGVGKSGGFRVLYFESEDRYILLFIDRRRELDAWPSDTILRLLKELGLWPSDESA